MLLLHTRDVGRERLASLGPVASGLDLARGNMLPSGFPLLLDGLGQLHWGAFAFLLDAYRVDSSQPRLKTLQTYSEGLKGWLEYLESRDADWKLPAASLLADYRKELAGRRVGRNKTSNATLNLRTATVREFYKFLISADWGGLANTGLDLELEPIKRFLAGSRVLRRAKKYKKKPRALTSEQVAAMAAELKTPYDLIFKWTLATGLRRTTAAELELAQLPRDADRSTPLTYMRVIIKGGKEHEVPVTRALLAFTWRYVDSHRAMALAKRGKTSVALFVNAQGDSITSNAYYQAFRRAARKLGIVANPHMTRHTFSVRMEKILSDLERQGAQVNPVKVLQHILGHSHPETTEIYLESVKRDEAGLLSALLTNQSELIK
ncbi:hypothetical protein E4419_13010 [Stenotrophomonas maltophilia]|nr:hypothetical protein E4419_13010 [Stenotrophomonas maltophilia]